MRRVSAEYPGVVRPPRAATAGGLLPSVIASNLDFITKALIQPMPAEQPPFDFPFFPHGPRDVVMQVLGDADRRQWPRAAGKLPQLIVWTDAAVHHEAAVLDESLTGVSLLLNDGADFHEDQEVRLSYGSQEGWPWSGTFIEGPTANATSAWNGDRRKSGPCR